MSAMSDLILYIKGQLANVGANPLNTQTAAAAALQKHRITVMKPGAATSGDDAAAATDIAETPIFVNNTGTTITVTSIKYCCGATGITGADATAPTLTIFSRNSAGGAQTSVGSFVFNLAAGVFTTGMQATFTLNATIANRTVPVGGSLTLTRTHAGGGIVIPGGTITIEYTED